MADKLHIAAILISAVSLCAAGVSVGITSANAKKLSEVTAAMSEQAETEPSATQFVMYVGTNDKDTYKPEHTREEAMQIVDAICLDYFDGYTLTEATGSWLDEKSNITHEYTIVCYFDGADEETVHRAADDIISALNQNTVLIEQNQIQMEYYSGSN